MLKGVEQCLADASKSTGAPKARNVVLDKFLLAHHAYTRRRGGNARVGAKEMNWKTRFENMGAQMV